MWHFILVMVALVAFIMFGFGLYNSFQKRLSPEAMQILDRDLLGWRVVVGIGVAVCASLYWDSTVKDAFFGPPGWLYWGVVLLLCAALSVAIGGWGILFKIENATIEANRRRILNGEISFSREGREPVKPTPAALPDERIITSAPSDFGYDPARFTAPKSGGQ